MRFQTLKIHAALLIVSVIYGYFYVAVKLLLHTLSPSEFIVLRFVFTAIIVLLINAIFIRKPWPKRSEWPRIAGLGLVGVFGVQILLTWGLHFTTAFHSSLIMGTIPIMTLLLGLARGQESFQSRKLIGILLGFFGVTILLFFTKSPDTPLPPLYLLGDAIVLLNAAAFGWFLIESRKTLQTMGSFPFMSYCYLASALVYMPIFFTENLLNPASQSFSMARFGGITALTPMSWALLAYVVLFASIGSYTLNNYALKRTNTTIVAVYIFLQPVISALAANLVLGEPFNIQMAIAGLLTLGGVLLATLGKSGCSAQTEETLETL